MVPAEAPAPGPATFQVLLDQVPNGANDATIELRFSAEADFVSAAADSTGNPFQLPGVSTSNAGCQDGATVCARFGGSNFFGPAPGPSIVLGELTLASNGASLDIIVASTSRYTDPVGGATFLTDGVRVGGLTGTAPEPASLVLLGLGLAGVAFLRRRA